MRRNRRVDRGWRQCLDVSKVDGAEFFVGFRTQDACTPWQVERTQNGERQMFQASAAWRSKRGVKKEERKKCFQNSAHRTYAGACVREFLWCRCDLVVVTGIDAGAGGITWCIRSAGSISGRRCSFSKKWQIDGAVKEAHKRGRGAENVKKRRRKEIKTPLCRI